MAQECLNNNDHTTNTEIKDTESSSQSDPVQCALNPIDID